MDESELKVIVNSEIRTSTSAHDDETQLSNQLEKALSYYLGDKFGNEIQDRSQVILTTVRDTIEWMMPQFMQIFCASVEVVRFDPESSEDEQQADLETKVVNHVFYKENEGFNVLYVMIKDALMQKNGIVKVYYEEKNVETTEKYENQTDFEFITLLQDEELEIKEHTQRVTENSIDNNVVSVHDVTFTRKKTEGQVYVDNIPPEEFMISDRASSVFPKDSPFCAHRTTPTRSDLIEAGYDEKKIDNIASSTYDGDNQVAIIRDYLDENTEYYPDEAVLDKSQQQIELYECYLNVDFDGDGIAELRQVVLAGNEILSNETIEYMPFAAICPNILPHKFHGLSVADDTMDLQMVESIIMRQCLDNMYAANNQRTAVNSNVNIDDLLSTRPNGVVRTKGSPVQDIMQLTPQNIIGDGLNMIDYLDTVKEQRTGVSKVLQGQSQTITGDTAHGLERVMSAAEAKIQLIARVFAETGIKEMFLMIRGLMQMHGQVSDYFLNKQVVNVKPQEWKDRKSTTVKVGLGTGDRLKMQAAMQKVLELQNTFLTQGAKDVLVSNQNVYAAVEDFIKYSGIPSADQYFLNPATTPPKPPQPPPPDPQMEAIKLQTQVEAGKLAQDRERLEFDKQKFKAETVQKQERMESDRQLSIEKQKNENTKTQQDHEAEMIKAQQKTMEFNESIMAKLTELELKYEQNVPGAAT